MGRAARRAEVSGMSLREFRIFQDRQPDGQRWELIEGTPVMTAPLKIAHQKISFNLVRLLNEALGEHDPSRVAVFAPGVDLGLGSGTLTGVGRTSSYAPEPDVAVIEDVSDPDQRIVRAAAVLAEVVSSIDEVLSVNGLTEQERVAVTSWERKGDSWVSQQLSDLDDVLEVACCGLRCHVHDLYVTTHLAAVPMPGRGI